MLLSASLVAQGEHPFHILFLFNNPHTTTATACCGFQYDRVSDLAGNFPGLFRIGHCPFTSSKQGNTI